MSKSYVFLRYGYDKSVGYLIVGGPAYFGRVFRAHRLKTFPKWRFSSKYCIASQVITSSDYST